MPMFLPSAVLLPTAAVVAAISIVLWRARTSQHDGHVAIIASTALALWSVSTTGSHIVESSNRGLLKASHRLGSTWP
jgi:hypothetical protein